MGEHRVLQSLFPIQETEDKTQHPVEQQGANKQKGSDFTECHLGCRKVAEGEDQRGDEVCKKVEPSRYWFVAAISSPHHVEDENQQGEEEETQHDLFDDTAVEHGEEQGYEGEGFLGIGSLDLGDPGSEEIVVADHHQCTAKTDQYGNQRLLFRKSERFEQAGSFCKRQSG